MRRLSFIDDLYRPLDLGEPCPSGSLCCDDAQIISNHKPHTGHFYGSYEHTVRHIHLQCTNHIMYIH